MKKILFSLVALVCSMSMNAQIMKVMKGNEVVATYTSDEADNVVFEEAKAPTTGTAKRTGDIEVKWVQLWENGPKFAEYNVGAANNKAEDCGGYYCWGSSINKDSKKAYKTGSNALTGNDDTAISLWGENWRMPTRAEFEALLNNCVVEVTTVNGVKGRKFTGKGDYASNSVFFPFAGIYDGSVSSTNSIGKYWPSTPDGSNNVKYLYLRVADHSMYSGTRGWGYSVRAVLAE